MDINDILSKYENIVFFGGAGVSTESGIPDFRSQNGIYNQKYNYPPETIVSHSFFYKNTSEFYKFYFDKMVYLSSKPNACHIKLAELEKIGKIKAVITQNIDGLHQVAGSKNVLELHGSILRNYCLDCGLFYNIYDLIKLHNNSNNGIPRCPKCGGIIKPDVVLYEENLDDNIISNSINYLKNAELVIVGGTSLSVYPAAGLLNYTSADIMLINKTSTMYDNKAKYIFKNFIGDLFSTITINKNE